MVASDASATPMNPALAGFIPFFRLLRRSLWAWPTAAGRTPPPCCWPQPRAGRAGCGRCIFTMDCRPPPTISFVSASGVRAGWGALAALCGWMPAMCAAKARKTRRGGRASGAGRLRRQGRVMRGVLLGQHADDQVETMLLALSRGAGLPGLSAMPARFERAGVMFYRPLLQDAICRAAGMAGAPAVAFVDDPTNTRQTLYPQPHPYTVFCRRWKQTFAQFRSTFRTQCPPCRAGPTPYCWRSPPQDLAAVGNPPGPLASPPLSPLSRAAPGPWLRHWLFCCFKS